ncbi:hypothetical protein IKG02_01255 [Candidatus Saccharibacteria bacterium]|nr:hypothetical protein [Candidatus Saccharibacteria bacterium]
MRIFISGISGTAMGPLALMAKKIGFEVFGTDLLEGAVTNELVREGIEARIGEQDGKFLEEKFENGGVDWFVYTSALPDDHAELQKAREFGIKTSKRDEFIEFLRERASLKMIAVAGTHGKTTTTAGIVFLATRLGLPVSWLVGTTLGFEEAGKYVEGSEFLIYEADEYDRNFLYYHPFLSIIPSISYDHPDIFPTEEDYKKAFEQFESQSRKIIKTTELDKKLSVSGKVRRFDLGLAIEAVREMIATLENEGKLPEGDFSEENMIQIANQFPGVGRRMERLTKGVYSDYAHHPEEIKSTIEIAKEEAEKDGFLGVVVVYEPHQNIRQHEVFSGYKDAFLGVEKVFWMPTFLTRENPELKIIEPKEFVESLENFEVAETAEFNEELYLKLKDYLERGYLVLLMSAGPGDKWFRKHFSSMEEN